MEKFQEVLTKLGTMADGNKYLRAIKNAFVGVMTFVIIGAIGTLWTNVICNADTGLGALWHPIMALSFLNPAFNALNFATMGCMSLFIAFLLGREIGTANNEDPFTCGMVGLMGFVSVSNTTSEIMDAAGNLAGSVSGLFSSDLGTNGLFTAMIISILSVEIYSALMQSKHLKITLPPQVPSGVSKSFEILIPGAITLIITSIISVICLKITGTYLSNVIFNLVQTPLMSLSGSLHGALTFALVSCLFWSIGLHGDNMISGINTPMTLALLAANTEAVEAGLAPTNIMNFPFWRTFFCSGGTGFALSLTLAILLVGKREENRSIAKMAILPNCFNINEINMFGLPVVLNPIMIIPFILVSVVSVTIGYVLTAIGFCPIMYINVPWTMPPFLMAFLAAGGSVRAGLTQLLVMAISTLIYIPFVKIYEHQQATLEAADSTEAQN